VLAKVLDYPAKRVGDSTCRLAPSISISTVIPRDRRGSSPAPTASIKKFWPQWPRTDRGAELVRINLEVRTDVGRSAVQW